MPTSADFEEHKTVISWEYHPLRDLYAVCEGLKLRLEQSPDYGIQNMFYNG